MKNSNKRLNWPITGCFLQTNKGSTDYRTLTKIGPLPDIDEQNYGLFIVFSNSDVDKTPKLDLYMAEPKPKIKFIYGTAQPKIELIYGTAQTQN